MGTNSDDVSNHSSDFKDSEDETSFVTRVKSRVSGLFNSSLSRIFGSQDTRSATIRRRDDFDTLENQPPCKKARGSENSNFSFNAFQKDNVNNSSTRNNLSNASTSSLFTNFVEPIAGPSGVRPQKDLHKILTSSHHEVNGDKDSDSGESTSGYSSMAKVYNKGSTSQASDDPKRSVSLDRTKMMIGGDQKSNSQMKSLKSKKLFDSSSPEAPSRSLFTDQSLSPQTKNNNASLSSRRPSFNTSSFGSPSFVDRTLTTSRIVNSPFYNGPTTYGGASAYARQQSRRQQQLKNSLSIKPVNKNETNPCASLSKTARRILETLEQYSAVVTDAKKIPLPTKVEQRGKQQGILSKYVGLHHPYSAIRDRTASNKELLVPTMPELLKMKQKQRLQDTTDKIRKIASSNVTENDKDEQLQQQQQQRFTGKIKSKITSVRPKAPTIEVLNDVLLEPVPLKLPENRLPKFDLVIPPPECLKKDLPRDEFKSCVVESKPMEKKAEETTATPQQSDPAVSYTFSCPLIIASDNLKSITAMNNFKFSEPLCKKVCLDGEKQSFKEKNNGDWAKKDPLLEKFKAPEGTWECSTCLIRNKAEVVRCAACETLRAQKATPSAATPKVALLPSSFGAQFSKKPDEWECAVCLIRNKTSNEKCVACGSGNVAAPKTNGFGAAFRLQSDQWECDSCLVRNKNDVDKCVACGSSKKQRKTCCESKKKTVSDDEDCDSCKRRRAEVLNKDEDLTKKFKPPSDTWECDTCLIRNKEELKNCAACQTPREKVFESSDKKSKASGKWECPTCMVRNEEKADRCPCCETPKPGVTLVGKNTVNLFNFGVNKSQFNFGVPKDQEVTTTPPTFTFGVVKANEEKKPVVVSEVASTTAPVFTFGVPSAQKEEKKEAVLTPASVSTFQFKKSDDDVKTAKVTSLGADPIEFRASEEKSQEIDKVKTDMFKFVVAAPKTASVAPNVASSPGGFSVTNVEKNENKPPQTVVNNNNNNNTSGGSSNLFSFGKANATPLAPSAAPIGTGFSFGKPAESSAKAQPMFSFGGSTTPAAPAGGGFSFSQLKNDSVGAGKAPEVGGFSFKAPETGGFSVKAPAGLFGSPAAQAPVAATAAAPPAAFPKNGGFNFGGSTGGATGANNSQAAVFTFGASQGAGAGQGQTSGGFNFAAPAPTAGGFNFTTPAFDANTKPSFNFTGGAIPSFAATPSEGGGGAPMRKIKKAVRRAAQR